MLPTGQMAISAITTALLVVPFAGADAPPVGASVQTVDPVLSDVRIERIALTDRHTVPTLNSKTQEVATAELSVEDFNVAAVTWEADADSDDDRLTTWMRVRTASGWTDWIEIHDDHHAPDPGPGGPDDYRAGTEPFITEDADGVEVRVVSAPDEPLPDDLQLEVIDPGLTASDVEVAEIAEIAEIAEMDAQQLAPELAAQEASLWPTDPALREAPTVLSAAETQPAVSALEPTTFAVPARPAIRSRATWGADETLRRNYGDPIQYGTIKGAFVHHTAGTNSYSAADVPRLIRGIYHYHVVSRDFYDIGYNFLIDRFGQVWEGAYGGMDRAVVAAHTKYYNSSSFGLSAMGDYTSKEPEAALLDSMKQLLAWKLALHGVTNPWGTADYTYPGSDPQSVISGHRDTKSTACPGQLLYNKLANIRSGTQARMASVPAHLTLSGPAALAKGSTAQLTITWAAGKLPVSGTVALQRLVDGTWAHVRNVDVTDVATTPITPGGDSTYRVRATVVAQPVNVAPIDTSNRHPVVVSTGPVVVPDAACTEAIMADDGFVDTFGSFEGPIACARHWGITSGTSATHYSPYVEITREQTAAFIARLIISSGGSLPASPSDAFSDDTTSSFQLQINQLAAVGIVGGTSRDSFSAKRIVTRAQLAAFLTRAYDYRASLAGLEPLPAGPDAFADDDWNGLEGAINSAAAVGLIAGYADGTFRPGEPVRRDHMAGFVTRTLDLIVARGMSIDPAI